MCFYQRNYSLTTVIRPHQGEGGGGGHFMKLVIHRLLPWQQSMTVPHSQSKSRMSLYLSVMTSFMKCPPGLVPIPISDMAEYGCIHVERNNRYLFKFVLSKILSRHE